MSIVSSLPSMAGGHYDHNGEWVQTKHCFVYCGPERCTCQPPMGQHYSPQHDKRAERLVPDDPAQKPPEETP